MADTDSPVPRRSPMEDDALTAKLRQYDTLAERLDHLVKTESWTYRTSKKKDSEYVTDPTLLAEQRPKLYPTQFKVPAIAQWVRERTGTSFTKSALYQFLHGERLQPRTVIANGLADFWRIDSRLLDLNSPVEDPNAGVDELDPLEHRLYELMTEVGFQGVKPREVKASLDGSTEAGKYQFLAVLEGLREHQRQQRPDLT